MHAYKIALLLLVIISFEIIVGKPYIYTPYLPPGGKIVIDTRVGPEIRSRFRCFKNIRLMSQHMTEMLIRIEDALNLIYPRVNGIRKILEKN